MMSDGEWSRTEKISLISLIVAIIACVSAILLPEVRQFLRLERPIASSLASADQLPILPATPQNSPVNVGASNINSNSQSRNVPEGHVREEKYIELADAQWKSMKKVPSEEGATPYSGYLDDKALEKPAPVYPAEATKTIGLDEIIIEIVVDESGKVISTYHYWPDSPIVKAAIDAAYKAKFPKPLLNGKPSKMYGSLRYKYPPK